MDVVGVDVEVVVAQALYPGEHLVDLGLPIDEGVEGDFACVGSHLLASWA